MQRFIIPLIMLIGLTLGLSLKQFLEPTPHYSELVMKIPGGTEITFLQETYSAAQCEDSIRGMASIIANTCPHCEKLHTHCSRDATNEQLQWLSEEPLSVPSARLVNGVVLYRSQDTAFALEICRQSQAQATSITQQSVLSCYSPGDTRPRNLVATHSLLDRLQLHLPALWSLLVAIAFVVIAWGVYAKGERFANHIVNWSRRDKRLVMLATDVTVIELTLWSAFSLRLESFYIPVGDAWVIFLVAPFIALPLFIKNGLYHSIIRYLGLHALLAVTKSVGIYTSFLIVVQFLLGLEEVPRSVPLIHGLLCLLLIGALRVIARNWFQLAHTNDSGDDNGGRKNTLIYGAGSAGVQLASALAMSREFRPVAFIDDSRPLHGHQVSGLIVHSPNDVEALIKRTNATEVLLALPSAKHSRKKEIIADLEPLLVHVRTVPSVAELAEGKVRSSDLREVGVEDILGRDPIPPMAELIEKNISGKAVMVTGAGGSIGSELCRQIIKHRPSTLILFEQNEFALYSIEMELEAYRDNNPGMNKVSILPILGSVLDGNKVSAVIQSTHIQTIFHAAAYKHVPIVEKNPIEGVENNIFGTKIVAEAAFAARVETFVLISTDKAVRPTNTMGATKRASELFLQALASDAANHTKFAIVRFGNVLESSGSVVPRFRQQIMEGGPVTVTDPRITRYFMTIPEAAELVIQAGALSDQADIFLLDMGEPVKILDLASQMIRLSGLEIQDANNQDGDIEIIFTGLRPGEKLYEELLIEENASTTLHPRIMRANEKRLSRAEVDDYLSKLSKACGDQDSREIRRLLLEMIDGFKPQCSNQDIVYLVNGAVETTTSSLH